LHFLCLSTCLPSAIQFSISLISARLPAEETILPLALQAAVDFSNCSINISSWEKPPSQLIAPGKL